MTTLEELVENRPHLKLLSKAKLYERVKDHGITRQEVNAFLSSKEITQVYARPKYTSKSDRLKITAPPYSFQIDVAILPAYKSSNKGIDKFFIAVDILSRKAFAYPLKKGSMSAVLKAYEQFLIDAGEPLNSVAGDAFFDNEAFLTMNQELGINVYTDVAKDDHITRMGDKLGIVDRCIRTLKQLIQKYMLAHETTRWTHFLPTILELYNSTPHTGIKNMSPDEVYDDYDYMMGLYKGQSAHNERANSKIKIKHGDRVRAMVGKGIFEKEKAKFSIEVYTVVRQEGYRFVLEDDNGHEVKRRYRPSELLVINKEVSEPVKRGHKKVDKASKRHAAALGVARELGTTYEEARDLISSIRQ